MHPDTEAEVLHHLALSSGCSELQARRLVRSYLEQRAFLRAYRAQGGARPRALTVIRGDAP